MSSPSYFPEDWSKVWLIGQFIDMAGTPMRGRVTVTANINPRRLVNRANRLIITTATFTKDLDAAGYFEIQLPATDDPDLTPTGWTYTVTEPSGMSYPIVLSVDTPVYERPGHPRDGDQVIDLYDVVPAGAPSGGVAQLIRGIGVESVDVDGGRLIVTYTDGTTHDAGPVEGGGTVDGVQDLIDTSVAVHRDDPAPHPVYDELPSLTLLFRSRLV